MQIKNFMKDKILFLAIQFFICIFMILLLYRMNINLIIAVAISSLYLIVYLIILGIEFSQKKQFYEKLSNQLESLDKKFLISEVMSKSSFYEGNILYDIVKVTNKAMNDEIAKYRKLSVDYREYIELWVHEIKTQIAGAKLIGENINNKDILEGIDKIDKFVEQALFYSRSNHVEKDFLIKELVLKDIVSSVLRKNSKYLIHSGVSIHMDSLDKNIFSDSKWVAYIIEQIIDNAVKYQSSTINIYAKENENNVALYIKDDGIGIPQQDVSRVFDKSFTGENGRKYGKSTGIGLYLSKKMCFKLGIQISLNSTEGKGTEVIIIFPKSNMYQYK